ncbi:MAG: C10 family peptidase [Muribaculaceae bacterium]|nr:C10 family peptidase [Muribaculaceae bacterium]
MKHLSFWALILINVALAFPMGAMASDEGLCKATAMKALKTSEELKRVASYPTMAVYTKASGGFAIVSTTGSTPRILAYSSSGTFSATTGNPGFNWWMRAMGKASLKETTKPDPSRFATAVEPLITTRWGQNEPCRYMCPFLEYNPDLSQYGVYIPDSTHNAVGCGPAAMAQLMNYYKFPKHGTGSASVVVKYDQANVTLSVDFEQATYDWDSMLDDYSGDYSEDNGRAVATLCYHAAVAAKTNWTRLGGGTFDENILNAFITHFNYCDSARLLARPLYDEPTWMETIYGMLTAGHPVLYSGKDINFEVGILVGHNFIIDGYDENGLVHVNWGWHGDQDGYFDIATLTVGKLTFNDWQGMYVNLYPNRENILGDVNCDGYVTGSDVTAIYQYILFNDTTFASTSDVNNDGHITASDVTAIYNILLGL